MSKFVNTCNKMPKVLKVILALPGLDLFWNIYRLVKSIKKKNLMSTILALLLVLVGWAFMWIIDIITIVAENRVIWFN